jgi:hypothetical protein
MLAIPKPRSPRKWASLLFGGVLLISDGRSQALIQGWLTHWSPLQAYLPYSYRY